jgi:hypothetical protein
MRRIIALALLVGLQLSAEPTHATDALVQSGVAKKLYELGYPADTGIAVQKWRSENRSAATGPLTDAETSALLAQPLPEFLGAVVGNPFIGMGLALRHKTRQEAEREAIQHCKAKGGGTFCATPLVVRAEQCVAVAGYMVTIERRPTYRTSVAISSDAQRSMNAAKEACPLGASHPSLCKPLVSFCGDGRDLHLFDGDTASEALPLTTSR